MRTDAALPMNSPARPPDPYIQRALTSVADMGLLEADHERTKFGQAEPVRHLASQYAALRLCPACFSLARDDQYERQTVAMGVLQEREQRVVGADLGHAVEIE